MKDSEQALEQLNVSGKEMEKMKNETLDTLQNLSSIAEESSAAAQQASASMEEISSSSEGLSDLAQNLHAIIMKFKV
jgi:methyl-accepting chemotaxis protein